MPPLLTALLLSLPAALSAEPSRPLAQCLYDSFYPAPEIFPGETGSQWHDDVDVIRMTWLGPDYLAKGRLIAYARITFAADGSIAVDVPKQDNPFDTSVIALAEPRRTVERRVSWCREKLSDQDPGS